MGRPARIKSYYAATALAAPAHVELESSVDCDVCVVGGGIAGCSSALHLAEAGYKVVLLEEYRVGWGASGRSGAQAVHGVASGQTRLERLIGSSAARTVWDVSLEGLALMKQLIARPERPAVVVQRAFYPTPARHVPTSTTTPRSALRSARPP